MSSWEDFFETLDADDDNEVVFTVESEPHEGWHIEGDFIEKALVATDFISEISQCVRSEDAMRYADVKAGSGQWARRCWDILTNPTGGFFDPRAFQQFFATVTADEPTEAEGLNAALGEMEPTPENLAAVMKADGGANLMDILIWFLDEQEEDMTWDACVEAYDDLFKKHVKHYDHKRGRVHFTAEFSTTIGGLKTLARERGGISPFTYFAARVALNSGGVLEKWPLRDADGF